MCCLNICLFVALSCFLLSSTADAQHFQLTLSQVPEGVIIRNVIETWTEAHMRCQNQGAILASPINKNAFNAMKALIGPNAMFYTGIKASSPGQFVSVEGVPLESMDVSLWQQLDPWNGDCLAITVDSLHVVPCETRLPYMCYKTPAYIMNKTNCGFGYTYDVPTKNCYKLHTELLHWHEAQMTCVAEAANLAVIDNDLEAESINNIYGRTSHIWIGLRDHTGFGDWISVHWQPVEELYNVWSMDKRPEEYTCGTFHIPSVLKPDYCNAFSDFICEKEPTY